MASEASTVRPDGADVATMDDTINATAITDKTSVIFGMFRLEFMARKPIVT